VKKFAVLGVDTVSVACSERAGDTHRNAANMRTLSGTLGRLGTHHVAGLKAANSLGASVKTTRESVPIQIPECPASRKGFANLLPAAGEFKQTEHPGRLVPIFVGDGGNAGGLAAGVEFDPDGLNLAHDTVLRADRKRVAAMDDCTAAFKKQASPFLTTRHQRPLALIDNEYRQLRLLNFALTGLVTLSLRAISPRESCGTGV
jgi:hypothetical protein